MKVITRVFRIIKWLALLLLLGRLSLFELKAVREFIFPILAILLILAQDLLTGLTDERSREGNAVFLPFRILNAVVPIMLVMDYILIISICLQYMSEWPGIRSWAGIFLLIFLPGLIYQLVWLIWYLLKQTLPTRRLLLRGAAIIAGVTCGLILITRAEQETMRFIKYRYAPLTITLEAAGNRPAALDRFFEETRQTALTKPAAMYYDGDRYILTFHGRSVHAGGSTVFFDGKSKEWSIFLNSNIKKRARFDALIKDLKKHEMD